MLLYFTNPPLCSELRLTNNTLFGELHQPDEWVHPILATQRLHCSSIAERQVRASERAWVWQHLSKIFQLLVQPGVLHISMHA